jgi:hypothetical protein
VASFRLRTDAEQWFSEIEGSTHIRSKFDLYYVCLMAGFASGRSSESQLTGAGSRDFIDYFIDDYKPASRLLIGLLVIAEMKYKGIDVSEKAAVRALFKTLVDANNGNNTLTDEGMKRMNAYASGGFEYLAEQRDTKPYSVEEFLRDYVALVGEALVPA